MMKRMLGECENTWASAVFLLPLHQIVCSSELGQVGLTLEVLAFKMNLPIKGSDDEWSRE
jgi:hypothetical protein